MVTFCWRRFHFGIKTRLKTVDSIIRYNVVFYFVVKRKLIITEYAVNKVNILERFLFITDENNLQFSTLIILDKTYCCVFAQVATASCRTTARRSRARTEPRAPRWRTRTSVRAPPASAAPRVRRTSTSVCRRPASTESATTPTDHTREYHRPLCNHCFVI